MKKVVAFLVVLFMMTAVLVGCTSEPVVEEPAVDYDNMDSKVSDVQLAAIKATLGLREITYEELAKAAFEHDNFPESPDDLSYEEAVTIIRYSNNMRDKLGEFNY